ncbi:hypothetical protein [Vibrio fluvialis]|uniref:Uncharacterized protein n=1 Tax=Vibrio fluvialis PG41 TaxID=1336752 RepID=S7I1F5_VIBFL|nr:hypothetical protein [Vibrio fluvialis]EPP21889.1 hypothetical protein L910_1082 [Vibrio fluvialis PG41]MBY7844408.1 hypothetical protein [Vibrio fluvialis]MBY7864109.1 hypothetical protein [Vibrio fluvialis]MCG6347777.1 hypothetical protein [Vibrio fluvialis]WIE03720.1 hypothetical protein QN061_02685 [Vibrio fluvialis]
MEKVIQVKQQYSVIRKITNAIRQIFGMKKEHRRALPKPENAHLRRDIGLEEVGDNARDYQRYL